MTYEEFIKAVGEYWKLFEGGLKKQANKLLFEFTDGFEIGTQQSDAILERFCREFFDEGKHSAHHKGGASDLPFQVTRLMNDYLRRQSEQNRMPQMRWAYQLFGNCYNPHDPQNEHPAYSLLERAYNHPQRDSKTAELYFNEQLETLYWGAHHFPDGCCIKRSVYEETLSIAEKILMDNEIPQKLVSELEYYKKLYEVYYEWTECGRQGDFPELCRAAGLNWSEIPAYYYNG